MKLTLLSLCFSMFFSFVYCQNQSTSSRFYSGRNQIKSIEESSINLIEYELLYFRLESNHFETSDYTKLIAGAGYLRTPRIVIQDELLDKYRYIGVKYQEIHGAGGLKRGYFYSFLVTNINSPALEIITDSNHNYRYDDQYQSLIVDREGNINLFFINGNLSINHPLKSKSESGVIVADIIKPNHSYSSHENFLKWYYRHRVKLAIGLNVDFGLGGFGRSYYDYIYKEAGNDYESEVSYEYNFRSGFASIEPYIKFRKWSLGLVYSRELRQPNSGVFEFESTYEGFYDDGISKIFPKGKESWLMGLGYSIPITETIDFQPFVRFGLIRYIGFASKDFNEIHQRGRSVVSGLSVRLLLNSFNEFHFTFSGNYDRYDLVTSELYVNPNTGTKIEHQPNDQKFYQMNFSMGYNFKFISR